MPFKKSSPNFSRNRGSETTTVTGSNKNRAKPGGQPSRDTLDSSAENQSIAGASAGGLEALSQFLQGVPSDTGVAVVVVQHPESSHESVLVQLPAKMTARLVVEVRERMQPQPDHMYVTTAHADLNLLDGLFHLAARRAPVGRHRSTDHFLESLGEARKSKMVCLYRIAQESLRNIQKYSPETNKVPVSLAGSRRGMTLRVGDNGLGFDLDEARKRGGPGSVSMQERVRPVNGSLTARSQPGTGSTVSAFPPKQNLQERQPV